MFDDENDWVNKLLEFLDGNDFITDEQIEILLEMGAPESLFIPKEKE